MKPEQYLRSSLSSSQKSAARQHIYSELGTRQHCRNNVTMFSDHKFVEYCSIIPEALLRCRCREAINLSRAQFCLFDYLG